MDNFLDRQTLDFGGRVLQNLPPIDVRAGQDWIECPGALKEVLRVALSCLSVSPFAITVDRSVTPVYPDWVDKVVHPELAGTGPAEFYLKSDVAIWHHDDQKNAGKLYGVYLYRYLRDRGMLTRCLGLQEGAAIQQKGVDVFQRFFRGYSVFLWKSTVQHNDGSLWVASLRPLLGRVDLWWEPLESCYGNTSASLLFGEQLVLWT